MKKVGILESLENTALADNSSNPKFMEKVKKFARTKVAQLLGSVLITIVGTVLVCRYLNRR